MVDFSELTAVAEHENIKHIGWLRYPITIQLFIAIDLRVRTDVAWPLIVFYLILPSENQCLDLSTGSVVRKK